MLVCQVAIPCREFRNPRVWISWMLCYAKLRISAHHSFVRAILEGGWEGQGRRIPKGPNQVPDLMKVTSGRPCLPNLRPSNHGLVIETPARKSYAIYNWSEDNLHQAALSNGSLLRLCLDQFQKRRLGRIADLWYHEPSWISMWSLAIPLPSVCLDPDLILSAYCSYCTRPGQDGSCRRGIGSLVPIPRDWLQGHDQADWNSGSSWPRSEYCKLSLRCMKSRLGGISLVSLFKLSLRPTLAQDKQLSPQASKSRSRQPNLPFSSQILASQFQTLAQYIQLSSHTLKSRSN